MCRVGRFAGPYPAPSSLRFVKRKKVSLARFLLSRETQQPRDGGCRTLYRALVLWKGAACTRDVRGLSDDGGVGYRYCVYRSERLSRHPV